MTEGSGQNRNPPGGWVIFDFVQSNSNLSAFGEARKTQHRDVDEEVIVWEWRFSRRLFWLRKMRRERLCSREPTYWSDLLPHSSPSCSSSLSPRESRHPALLPGGFPTPLTPAPRECQMPHSPLFPAEISFSENPGSHSSKLSVVNHLEMIFKEGVLWGLCLFFCVFFVSPPLISPRLVFLPFHC